MPVALIADVHGNRWALEAVLADVRERAVDAILDLGDSVYGPLDPRDTAELLIAHAIPSVRGNEDRIVLEEPRAGDSETLRYTRGCLKPEQAAWLAALPRTRSWQGELLCFHGTPERDDAYLLEAVGETGVRLKGAFELAAQVHEVREAVVACGHSHVPRTVTVAGGPLIVNPGSVGLPAYADDEPFPHAMEAGSPHARYAILEGTGVGWRVEHVAVPYDWESAATAAEARGRPDWAAWLRIGRAAVPDGGSE